MRKLKLRAAAPSRFSASASPSALADRVLSYKAVLLDYNDWIPGPTQANQRSSPEFRAEVKT
jgi:hypothetical protein